MNSLLEFLLAFMINVYNKILSINDSAGYFLTDKQLHFIVMGLLGFGLLCLVFPLFKYLVKRNQVLILAFIYTFTLIVVICFAIEFGQYITQSGTMDIMDVTSGIAGFLFFFVLFGALYFLITKIYHYFKKQG